MPFLSRQRSCLPHSLQSQSKRKGPLPMYHKSFFSLGLLILVALFLSSSVQLCVAHAQSDIPNVMQNATVGRILFWSGTSWDQPHDLYVMNLDGTNKRRLTNGPGSNQGGVFSPDGSKIAFFSNRTGTWNIYTMNVDGTDIRMLAPATQNWEELDWSVNDRIVYVCDPHAICVMNSDGSNQRKLTSAWDNSPRWSADGTKIIFQSYRDGNKEIYMMNADGSNQTNVTRSPTTDDGLASLSPDGTKIAYTVVPVSYQDEIWIMNTDGSDRHAITGNEHNEHAIWSPDGSKIVFNSNRAGPLRNIYVMNKDGSNPIRLTYNDEVASDWWVPVTNKPVVVLVHGWMGFGRQTSCSEGIAPYPFDQNFDGENGDLIGDLPDWLNSAGFEVWSAHLTTGPAYTASLQQNARCLRDQIARVPNRIARGKVILIAHSMGGLVARAYLEDNNLYQYDVKTLITLGSPHQGVPVPWWDRVKRLAGFFIGWNCGNQEAVCQFTQGIDQFNRDYKVRRDKVDYYTVSGDLLFLQSRGWGRVFRALIPEKNDGAVPQASGLGLSGQRQALETNEAHIKDFGVFSYFGPPPGDLYSYAYDECIQPVLAGTRDGCHKMAAQSPQASAFSFNALSPIVEGILSSGQQVTQPIGLDGGGNALFAATWATDTITLTLKSPTGQVIDAAYAAANPGQVSYLTLGAGQTPLGASYALTSTEIGMWTMQLEAGDLPGGSASYALFAAMESPITLTAETDRGWYVPGASVTLTAMLSGSPASATITASISRADNVTDTISLSALGIDQYQAIYIVPNAPGYAQVQLVASGLTTSSLFFERGTSLAFQISPQSVALNDTYSDVPQPHFPGASLYQALTVTTGITSAISGTIGLSADLVDASNNFVAHSLTIQDVITGTSILALRFDGDDIYASTRNGPYTLTNLLLTDQRGAPLAVAEAQNVYVTAAYNYRSFARPSMIYLPFVLRD